VFLGLPAEGLLGAARLALRAAVGGPPAFNLARRPSCRTRLLSVGGSNCIQRAMESELRFLHRRAGFAG
jgi:hypothetical protein